MTNPALSGAEIRAAIETNTGLRERDLATKLDISEAQLVAANVGRGVTRIAGHPDQVIPAAEGLGQVMALTRNDSCVHEKVGEYLNYHPGDHAAMVLTHEIDLRIFPSHWVHGFAVEKETDSGIKRSVQVFNAAGDAVHKVHLRPASNLDAWETLKSNLALPEQHDTLAAEARKPPELPKSRSDKKDVLLREWDRLTDTHQFLRLCSKLKMNRLGAYRIAGAPYAKKLALAAVDQMLEGVRDAGCEIMFFVGNKGCIQIHNGPVQRLKRMGPWQNILDPGFDMHLRSDHIAEVWAVMKPTQRGPVLSVEVFDQDGTLICQTFPVSKEANDHRAVWKTIFEGLEPLTPDPVS